MGVVEIKTKAHRSIKVVRTADQREFITAQEAEMDARAKQAVKAAIEKAKFCKKPIARYDSIAKRAYIEYPDGEKRYVK